MSPHTVQVQMSPGCGHGVQTVALVRDVLERLAPGVRVEIIDVTTQEDAERLGFPGSPTVLVDRVDIEPHPPGGVGVGRLHGLAGVPPRSLVEAAVRAAMARTR